MGLFDVILKLIQTLSLVESSEYAQLNTDVKAWKDTATEQSEDKLKSLYAKMHKGVFVKLLMPFLYFYLVKWVRDMVHQANDLPQY